MAPSPASLLRGAARHSDLSSALPPAAESGLELRAVADGDGGQAGARGDPRKGIRLRSDRRALHLSGRRRGDAPGSAFRQAGGDVGAGRRRDRLSAVPGAAPAAALGGGPCRRDHHRLRGAEGAPGGAGSPGGEGEGGPPWGGSRPLPAGRPRRGPPAAGARRDRAPLRRSRHPAERPSPGDRGVAEPAGVHAADRRGRLVRDAAPRARGLLRGLRPGAFPRPCRAGGTQGLLQRRRRARPGVQPGGDRERAAGGDGLRDAGHRDGGLGNARGGQRPGGGSADDGADGAGAGRGGAASLRSLSRPRRHPPARRRLPLGTDQPRPHGGAGRGDRVRIYSIPS